MKRRFRLGVFAGLAVVSSVLVFGAPAALAAVHGVAQTKGCTSPVKIGDPYTCTANILNTVDTGFDTIRVFGFSDTVKASGGDVSTLNILSSTGLIFGGPAGAVSCVGGAGAGTAMSPYLGATECELKFNGTLGTVPFSHYTVQPGDFNLATTTQLSVAAAAGATNIKTASTAMQPGQTLIIEPNTPNAETRTATVVGTPGAGGTGITFATPLSLAHAAGARVDLFAHRLTDTARWDWANTCTFDPDGDCTTDPQVASAGASAIVQKLDSSTATTIHNAAHGPVTVVEAGTTVHDFVSVTGQPGSPFPSGNVTIDFFTNNQCNGGPAASSGNIALAANGTVDATGFTQGPLAAGFFGFRAHYLGDATYNPSDGPCEPLQVVDANIQINPPTANNPVGTNHLLTCHININAGGGYVPAPAGTVCTVNIIAGPGTPVSQNCATVGATGECQVTITSATPGTSTIQATTTLSIAGVSLTRTTGDAHVGDGPNAAKNWADDVVTTKVRDAANNDITGQTVAGGTVVHDEATVAKAAGTPAAVPDPTGTVSFTLFNNLTCNGAVLATDPNKPLMGGMATSATFTTPANGAFSYLAHYNGDANYPAHDGPCEPFSTQTQGTCPAVPAAFGLGAAGNYSVLGLAGAKLILSEGATKIQGDVGLGANGTGSILKLTIDGKLFLDPTAHPSIHSDAKITGGIVIKSMAQEHADALAANLALAALPPTQPLIGTITSSTTINGGPGMNVVSLAGVNMVKGTLTISGSASSLFVINVMGGFNFSSSQMVLTGGVQPNNIIFNFIGPGADVNIFKTVTVVFGTFLAPFRNIIQDHATITGRYIGAANGLSLKMHSAATLVCP